MLKHRASATARAGRSLEAGIRDILTRASLDEERVSSTRALQEWVDRLYVGRKPAGVVGDLGSRPQPMDNSAADLRWHLQFITMLPDSTVEVLRSIAGVDVFCRRGLALEKSTVSEAA